MRFSKLLLLSGLLLAMYSNLNAQIRFQKSFVFADGHVQVFSSIATSDGGYAMAGLAEVPENKMLLVKLDCNGNQDWALTFANSSSVNNVNLKVIETADGNLLMLHNVGDYFLNNMNAVLISCGLNGTVNWQKSYGGNRNDIGRDLIQLSDGNFAICGGTSSYGSDAGSNAYSDAFIMKLDAGGEIIWDKTFGTNSNIDDALALAEDADNGKIYATGRYITNGTFYSLLINVDASGELLWLKSYGKDNHRNYGFDVMLDAVGSVAFTGSTTNYRADFASNSDPFVIRINPTTGDTLWTRIILPSDDFSDNASSIDVDTDGNYLISAAVMSYSAFTQGFVPNKHAIYRMSQGGNLQLAKILNTGGSHYPSLQALPNGDVVYSGFSNQYTVPCCNFEPLLIRLGPNLQSGCNENDVFSFTDNIQSAWQVQDPPYEIGSGFGASDITGFDDFTFDSVNTFCSDIPPLTANFNWDNFCAGQPINFEDSSEGSPITWTWDFGNGPFEGSAEESFVFGESGTYPVSLTVNNGCGMDQISFDVIVQEGPFADAGFDQTIFAGESAMLGGDPTGPDGFFFSWEPAQSLDDPSSANPLANPSQTTLYTVTVNELEGCPSESSILITVIDPEIPDSLVYGEYFLPNIFSPNDDLLNDVLLVYGGPYKEFNLEIFDRWGAMVFKSTDQMQGWDGNHRGQAAQTGVYFYQFTGITFWDEGIETKGNLTLIR